MMATRSLYFVVLLMFLNFAQTSEPPEYSQGVSLYSSRSVYRSNYQASFFCTDTSFSIASVQWLINGTLLENLNLLNVKAKLSTGLGCLDITHIPLTYNGTTIQCRANFTNGDSILSNVLTLLVEGVSLYSSRSVYRPNYEASFFCIDTSFGAVSVQWLINGTLLENLNLSNANARFIRGLGRLDITHIPLTYNGTTIQCSANFGNSSSIFSNVLTLFVEGPLSAVRSLSAYAEHGNITITWTAPFSVDTLLSYCVKVYSTTSLIHTECEISTTEYSFPIGRVCSNNTNYYYTFIVTPVNVAGNGESAMTNYTQSVAFSAPLARAIQYLRMSDTSEVSTYQILMSSPVCDGEVMYIDQDTGEKSTLSGSELMISGDTISIASEQLSINRHYILNVSANNAYGSDLSHIMLSTHGIKDIVVDETPHIVMTTEYFKNSTNKGAFLFLLLNCRLIDFNRSLYLFLDRNASLIYTLPDDLTPGPYLVSAYDIESDGTLHNGVSYPADRYNFSFGEELNTPQPRTCVAHVDGTRKLHSKDIKDCTVTLNGDIISAACSYFSDSAATGFQIIVQMKNTKADVLMINRTTKYFAELVTVQVDDENGTYHVAIFPLLGEKGIVNATLAYEQELPTSASFQENSSSVIKIAVAVSIVMGIMISIIIGHLLFWCWKRKRSKYFTVP